MESFKPNNQKEKNKADVLLRYINSLISKYESSGEERESQIARVWADKSAKEKADELYDAILSLSLAKNEHAEEKQEEVGEKFKPSASLISRIKVLISDQAVRDILPETFGRARIEQKEIKSSEISKDWHSLEEKIESRQQDLWQKEGDLIQKRVNRVDELKELKSEVEELSEILEEDKRAQGGLETLSGLPKTPENTDTVAMLNYEKFLRYRSELDEGFVWLPSRTEIANEAMKIFREGSPEATKLGVWFISEPGTGKTELIRAASKKLTGMDRVKIDCGPRTGDKEFFGEQKVFPNAENPEEATYYDFHDTITSAWTGYDFSYQKEPARQNAQVVELDEMPKLFDNEVAFSKIKNLFSLRDGDTMNGKQVLPGRMIFGSGNVGSHHNNKQIPPALERHFKVIPVDYPEMSKENPELYEFMISALIEKGSFTATKEEVSPYFKEIELTEKDQEVLEDGSVVVGKQELLEDATSKKHGFLYRLAHAIKSVQNAYMARGGENDFIDYTKRDRLRTKTDENGNEFISGSGEPLTVSTTITLQDLTGWINGYKTQLARKDSLSLTEYMQVKLKEKIDEKYSESSKLKAIFEHFGLLDEGYRRNLNSLPLTPKDIGYLSPRVPRPLKIEKFKNEEGQNGNFAEKENSREVAEKELVDILLENGERHLLKVTDFENISVGQKIKIGDDILIFSGASSKDNSPVVKFANEDLYKIISVEELNIGILENFESESSNHLSNLKEISKQFWEANCKKQEAPQW